MVNDLYSVDADSVQNEDAIPAIQNGLSCAGFSPHVSSRSIVTT
jgi:hypothetical protein